MFYFTFCIFMHLFIAYLHIYTENSWSVLSFQYKGKLYGLVEFSASVNIFYAKKRTIYVYFVHLFTGGY